MSTIEETIFYRRNLPHYFKKDAIYFVTFRLAGSLHLKTCKYHHKYRQNPSSFVEFDNYLDSTSKGPHWLKVVPISRLVAEAIESDHDRGYTLWGYCIMPNHVHLIIQPFGTDVPLNKILQLLKKETAIKANQALGRSGQFWQHESYDHIIRNAVELERVMKYVWNNPVKAGLVSDASDWPWSLIHWGIL
ncbi:MAG: transposase [Ignavibacteriales bacterium]|nr:transposase [Ignavibacteriales bacterium]